MVDDEPDELAVAIERGRPNTDTDPDHVENEVRADNRPDDDAARVLGEYNLTAVPVIDDNGILVGAVNVDDALAELLPDIWHRRGSRNFG